MYKKTALLTLTLCALILTGCAGEKEDITQNTPTPEPEKNMSDPMTKNDTSEPAMKTDTMTEETSPTDLTTTSPVQYTDISAEEAQELIDTNPELVVIDVSPKYAEGHLPGAINHYVGDGSLDTAIPTLNPEAMYLVYCHNDAASTLGAQKLIDAGFEYVYRLEGNYGAWIDAGYPIEK